MTALARKIETTPFGIKQHVPVKEHQGVGNPEGPWNWEPKKNRMEILFNEATASSRTRTNTNGIADEGEYY